MFNFWKIDTVDDGRKSMGDTSTWYLMNGHKILYSGAVLGSTYYGIWNGVQYLHYVVLTACILMFIDYRIPWVKTSLIDRDGIL